MPELQWPPRTDQPSDTADPDKPEGRGDQFAGRRTGGVRTIKYHWPISGQQPVSGNLMVRGNMAICERWRKIKWFTTDPDDVNKPNFCTYCRRIIRNTKEK